MLNYFKFERTRLLSEWVLVPRQQQLKNLLATIKTLFSTSLNVELNQEKQQPTSNEIKEQLTTVRKEVPSK